MLGGACVPLASRANEALVCCKRCKARGRSGVRHWARWIGELPAGRQAAAAAFQPSWQAESVWSRRAEVADSWQHGSAEGKAAPFRGGRVTAMSGLSPAVPRLVCHCSLLPLFPRAVNPSALD